MSMNGTRFEYTVAKGWLRDLASEPTPHDPWPCIRWDDQLVADQMRFMDVQADLGITYNRPWGLFVAHAWPVPLENVVDRQREEQIVTLIAAAHSRGLKVLAGVGVYSWGFDEVIAACPEVSGGDRRNMCGSRPAAWDWQRRVLDFHLDPRWGFDGISMQSADQGRCRCPECAKLPPAHYHANLLVRCAEYVRAQRPGWVIGQAAWGMRIDDPTEFSQVQRIAAAVDYMVEVNEISAASGRRKEIISDLQCAFGSVGGVFAEPPQHWDRLRWFVPCGLASADAIARLWKDGGRACEYHYRPFANPAEEVSWRVGARILSSPDTPARVALAEALRSVYGVFGDVCSALVDWYARAEDAYFSRSRFEVGSGPLHLEPLVWETDPAVPGPPVYLQDLLSADDLKAYARDLRGLKADLAALDIPNHDAARKTEAAIDGALGDLAQII